MLTRLLPLAAAAVLAGAALSGCSVSYGSSSSSPSPAASAAPSASPSPSVQPEQRLLTVAQEQAALPVVADLGTGKSWKTSSDTGSGSDDSGTTVTPATCQLLNNQVSTDFKGYERKIAAKKAAVFEASEANGGSTELQFEITSWTNAADSLLPIQATSVLDNCPTFTIKSADGSYKFTSAKVSTPRLGEQQAGFELRGDVTGVSVYLFVYLFQTGHNLISVVQTGTDGTNPIPAYQPLVQSILTKLAAG